MNAEIDFDEQLEQLHVELIKMGALCEEAISASVKALLERRRSSLRKKPLHIDARDRPEGARHREPVPASCCCSSSRWHGTCGMISVGAENDLRHGAHRRPGRRHRRNRLLSSTRGATPKQGLHIDEMAQATIKMVTDSVQSFVSQDLELVHAVIAL